jgi:hypothetical protein
MTTSQTRLIVELATGGSVDRQLQADPPPIVADGRVVLDRLQPDEPGGGLGPPEAGEIIMTVLSPEALTRESQQVRDVVRHTARTDEPLVIVAGAAEELREEEILAVLDAAERADRLVILRILADA